MPLIEPCDGGGWSGRWRSARAIAAASLRPSSGSMRTSPSSSARAARMYCSIRGTVRGTMSARLSKDRISQNVL